MYKCARCEPGCVPTPDPSLASRFILTYLQKQKWATVVYRTTASFFAPKRANTRPDLYNVIPPFGEGTTMQNSHGSASLLRHGLNRIPDEYFTSPHGLSFLLCTNAPPNKYGPHPTNPEMNGQPIVDRAGNRIDNANFGQFWTPLQTRGHALTFGYTQTGKSGLIVPAALTYQGNMVFNDPKGEIWWLASEHRASHLGHKCVLADPFGEVNKGYGSKVGIVETVTRYNPLAELRPDLPDFAERVAIIGEALAIKYDGDGNIFSGTGQDCIEGVIAMLATEDPGRATLREVRRWLTLSNPDFAGGIAEFLKIHKTGLAASKLRRFTDMTDRMNTSTKGTAMEQTKFLDSEQLLKYFEPEPGEPTFSMDELATSKLTLNVVLPGRLLGAYSAFTRLMFNQALDAVGRARQENMDAPIAFMCDEAGTSLGHLKSIEQAYGLSAGQGVLIWQFYQSLPQLKGEFPKTYNDLIANSAAITVLAAKDEETCEYFSKWLGNSTIPVTTQGQTTGVSRGGESSGSSTSTSSTGRPPMFPAEIREMDPAQMLTLIPGVGNFRTFKVRYFEDSRFTGMYRPDPKWGDRKPEPLVIPPPIQPTHGKGKPAKVFPLLIGGTFALFALVLLLAGGNQPFRYFVMIVCAVLGVWLLRKGWPQAAPDGPGWSIVTEANGMGHIRQQ